MDTVSLAFLLAALGSLAFKTVRPLAAPGGVPLTVPSLLAAAAGLSALCRSPRAFLAAARPAFPAALWALFLVATARWTEAGAIPRSLLIAVLGVVFFFTASFVIRGESRRRAAFRTLGAVCLLAALAGLWEVLGGDLA